MQTNRRRSNDHKPQTEKKMIANLLWSWRRMCFTACARVKVLPVPQGPMIRMGGKGIEMGVVMARMASFCLAFRRGSNCSSHCLRAERGWRHFLMTKSTVIIKHFKLKHSSKILHYKQRLLLNIKRQYAHVIILSMSH